MKKKYDGVIGVATNGETVMAVTRISLSVSVESLDRLNELIEASELAKNISRNIDGLRGMEVRLEFEGEGVTQEQAVLCLKSLLAESGVMAHPYVSQVNPKIIGARSLRMMH